MAMNQRRLQTILAYSSGVYFLPGSICSPRLVEDGRPEADLRAHALSIDVARQPCVELDGLAEVVVEVGVADADVHEPRQSRRQVQRAAVDVVVTTVAA